MQTTPSSVKYSATPTTNRETIETDLSNLRTRQKGFVRSESLRLTPPLDSKKDDVQYYRHKHKWRRKRRHECDSNGGHNLIEKFEAVIKTRVFELRLIGRRSWWPKPVWSKSKHINTSRHAMINMHQKTDNVNSNKDIMTKQQSIEGVKYTAKELIKKFDKCDSSILVVVQKQSKKKKKKIKWKFWIPKEKRLKLDDDETTIALETRDDMDQIIDDTTTRDGPSKGLGEEEDLENIISRLEEELRQMRVGKDKGKKTKKRIAEIMAGATVSTLGVVVAIILL